MRPAFQVFCSYTSRTVKRSRKMTKAAGSKKSSEDVLMNGHRSVNVNSKPSRRKGSFHGICKPEHEYRIVPVSRTKGGKDRHSKVRTFRGLRDRRIRLSVDTAIQFYDLQDRLGVEHPSMAVDWLITAAKDAIDKLPELGELASGSQITFSVGCLEKRDNGYSATTNATSAPQDEHSKIQDGKVREGKSTSSGSEGSVKASGADSTTTSKASRAKARQKARERTRRKTASAESKSVQLHQVLNELSSVQHSYSALIKNVAPLRLMKPDSHEGVQNHSFQHLLENMLPSYQDVICSNDTSNVVHQSASLCSSAFSRPLLSDSFTLPYDFRQVYEMEDFNIHVSDQKQRPTGRIESLPIHPNILSPKSPKNIEKETEQKYQYRSLLSAFSDTEMNVSYLGNRGPLQSNSDSASLISLDQKSSCQDDGMPTSEGVCLQSYGPCYRQ